MSRNPGKLIFVFQTLICGLVWSTSSTVLSAPNQAVKPDPKVEVRDSLTLVQESIVYLKVKHPGLLNERTKKDCTSGLSTKAVLLGQVLDPSGNVVFQNLGTISAKYDLWEEVYYITMYEDKYVAHGLEKVVEAFERPRPLRLVPLNSLKIGVAYRIRSVETINPLEQEKFEALQNWIIHQKSAVRGLGGGADGSVVPSVPESAFKALFYSLWTRSKLGELLMGELRREIVSEPFTVESLTLNGVASGVSSGVVR